MTVISPTFNLEEVKGQVGQEGACLKEKEREITLLVHPKYTTAQVAGVRKELDALARQHCKELGGMVMAYDKVRLLSPHGWMFDDNPFVHMRVTAKFYVFCPAPGDSVTAVVRKKSPHHLGCLAHGSYNVSVPRPTSESVDEWGGTLAGEGDTLTLTVLFTSLTNYHMPFIRAAIHLDSVNELRERQAKAELSEPKTENLPNRRTVFDEDSGISSNEAEEGMRGKKRKRSDTEEEEEEEAAEKKEEEDREEIKAEASARNKSKKRKRDEEEEEEEEDRKKRKKKKRDSSGSVRGIDTSSLKMEIEREEEEEEGSIETPSKKKKKKKRKEEEEEEIEEVTLREMKERIQIKIERISSDEAEETKKKKKKKKKKNQKEEEEEGMMNILTIKQEQVEESERKKSRNKESKKGRKEREQEEQEQEQEEPTLSPKKKKRKSLIKERVSEDEGVRENLNESSLPVPLFMIKKEFATPGGGTKRKVKKEER